MRKLALPFVVVLVGGVGFGAKQDGEIADRPYRDAAIEVGDWLRSAAIETEHGLTWPAAPAASETPSHTLYQGAPGVVVFLFELGVATEDEAWTELAKRGADDLLAGLDDVARRGAGLYTGAAGVGFALDRAYRRTEDERYRKGVARVADFLHESVKSEDGRSSWSAITDIISGDAGTGFFLLYSARALERPQDLELATKVGRSLLSRADRVEASFDWAMSPTYERRMPNFSHGTAGVATFLAALYGETGEEAFLAAAVGGAEMLLELADQSNGGFRVYHHTPEGEDLYYLGWCHGPVGTSRLFRTLANVTEEDVWNDFVERCAVSLRTSGLPEGRTPGYWENVGRCCGAAGVADFFLDHHAGRGQESDLALAKSFVDDVLERGTRDEKGLSWTQSEHRVRPDFLQAQTGLMQGGAGIGLVLLRLDSILAGEDERVVRFPEDVF